MRIQQHEPILQFTSEGVRIVKLLVPYKYCHYSTKKKKILFSFIQPFYCMRIGYTFDGNTVAGIYMNISVRDDVPIVFKHVNAPHYVERQAVRLSQLNLDNGMLITVILYSAQISRGSKAGRVKGCHIPINIKLAASIATPFDLNTP